GSGTMAFPFGWNILHMASPTIELTVYIVSDSTGITAETFSHSVLSQFEEVHFKPVRLPFIDTQEKAREVAARIDRNARQTGVPPIELSTRVDTASMKTVRAANGVFLDLFGTFEGHIEKALGLKPSHSAGRSHMAANSEQSSNRIDAINFSLANDDGQIINQLDQADVILVGV